MRIIFLTNNYTPYSGGVVSSINATVNELKKKGHTVFIITLNFLGTHPNDPDYVIRIPCPIKFRYKKNYMAIPWRPTNTITALIKKLSPDIIHIHHPFLLGISGVKAAKKCSLPSVFTYHTLYEQYAHYVPLPTFVTRPIIKYFVRRFCTTVDTVIAPSSAIKTYLIQQKITCPITTIASPLRPSFISSKKEPNHPADANIFNLLVVSRFVKEKNIPFIFEAFKQLPNHFTLTLVGYGDEYEKMQYMAYKQYMFCQKRVFFVHKPPIDTLLHLYQSANLFLFSSQTDTQGLVIIEALSQGLPVIALDGPGQRDTICNGINGFIVENAEQMAQTIANISKNTGLLAHLVMGAKKTAQNYLPDGIIDQVIQLYQSLQK
jgi:1,2-diacylglycerol 3-alpha-glucosyltransferase